MPRLAAFPKAYMDAPVRRRHDDDPPVDRAGATLRDRRPGVLHRLSGAAEAGGAGTRRAGSPPTMASRSRCSALARFHASGCRSFASSRSTCKRRGSTCAPSWAASYCRVLSGQRRPEVSREDGLRYAAESISACLPHAAACGVTLILENHYKDNYWKYPEFAQKMDVFCDLVDRIDSPHFGVNYDPSNAILAGEDPLELLRRVKHRVVTMHASDRYLAEGTIEDLRREEDTVGYAKRLRHGVIGRGLNDYDAIFQRACRRRLRRLDQHRRRRRRHRRAARKRGVS